MRRTAKSDGFAGQRERFNALEQQKSKITPRNNVLASALRATQIVVLKPALPAELIASILDYLPSIDLIRCARVSRRLQEMVYDDTRWIQRLRAMGVWNEVEARQRHDEGVKKKLEAQQAKQSEEVRRTGIGTNGAGRERGHSVTLFDAAVEEDRYKKSLELPQQRRRLGSAADGFDDLTISPTGTHSRRRKSVDPALALVVLKRVRSIRGFARHEFGKVYGALGPFYADVVESSSSNNLLVFRIYHDPEQQAQVLANLKILARSDFAQGWLRREETLETTTGAFENTVLREFERGFERKDINQMRRHAHALVSLNGGAAVVDTFISINDLMVHKGRLGNPLDGIDGVAYGHVDLGPSQRLFQQLAEMLIEQAALIDQVFPPTLDVLIPFLSRISEHIITEYINSLFDAAHEQGMETFLKAVSGVFEQCMRFAITIKPSKASKEDFAEEVKSILARCFEPHIDLYLTEEFEFFKSKSDGEVTAWDKQLSDQEAQADSFFMSNINRIAVKRDFLASFKKVVMRPVSVLPAFPGTASRSVSAQLPAEPAIEKPFSMPTTPRPISVSSVASTQSAEAPTTELAAKAAIMNSRLEGIKSLFSIEVALNLIHYAKSSLERAAIFVRMGGSSGEKAKEQSETIFISLLRVLGDRHVKGGFDKAVGHLSSYNPRDQSSENRRGVEPLVIFLELVNVGDLIQQMVDVFYVQELVATKLTDRDDFLNPAGKEKKRFEQMLDERVAAGMSKGIDVLIDEVEFVCATTQQAADFNPGADDHEKGLANGLMDIGPSKTALQVVETISSHTGMLVGSTDKNMLDVFNQEVGLRLFGVLCKHIKRQRISVDGAIKLISDINHYSAFVSTLRQKSLIPYFTALRELSQIYLIDCTPTTSGAGAAASRTSYAKELATIIADTDRYRGMFGAEEVYEFAERRADWYTVKRDVERAMYGIGCTVM